MTIKDKISLAQNIAVISGIFCVIVAILLLLNFWQVSQSDPVESKVMEALVERLNTDPGNEELKTEIRNFDLLARKAYFNSRWQIKTGAYLLLFGCIILGASLKVYYSLKSGIDEPDKELENEITGRILAQKGIILVGAVIFVLAIIASFFTVNHLEKFKVNEFSADKQAEAGTDKGIEVIDVDNAPVDLSTTAEVMPEQESGQITQNNSDENISETDSDGQMAEAEQNTESGSDQPDEVVPAKQAALTVDLLRRNHNSFRGPFSQGIIYHKNIPVEWDGSGGKSVLWKTPVPKKGLNSPVIWGDKIFLSGADEKIREVYCFNRSDGKLLWTGRADNIPGSPSSPPGVTDDTGFAAPSVTTDGKGVYAIYATGDIVAFTVDGKRIWAKNLGVPDNHYGHSSSLLVWDNMLFVQYDTNKGGKVMALDPSTGNTVWETVRKAKISWASPVLAESGGKYQLILTADPIVAGYDIKTGEELWAVECMMGEVGPSVGFSSGIVYAANEYARLVAIDIISQNILWEQDMYLPEASSPLAHNGLVVIATSYGVLACYDAKSGEQYWEDDVGTTFYSSPVFADGKLFIMDNEGVMRIYEFSKEKKLLGENPLGENSGATPAFMEGRVYLRGDEHLYCIGN
ncbi:MAG: PQQ-binding-like beta-propeller repeat protein [Prolixibacteraceae bacterium]|nr:PQQ-binding-like beta-propeller repeat protein [Prolixibacteraceae bacterium]